MHLIHVVPAHRRSAPTAQLEHLQSAGHSVQEWRRSAGALAGVIRDGVVLVDARQDPVAAQEFCRGVNRLGRRVPVLVVLEPAQLGRVGGDWRIDDLLLSTATPLEWAQRLRWAVERGVRERSAVVAPVDGVALDGQRFTLTLAGRVVAVTSTEHRVLDLFFRNPAVVLTRDTLLAEVWDGARYSSRHIDTFVCRLRRKLGPQGDSLETVRGVGYRFTPRPVASPSRAA